MDCSKVYMRRESHTKLLRGVLCLTTIILNQAYWQLIGEGNKMDFNRKRWTKLEGKASSREVNTVKEKEWPSVIIKCGGNWYKTHSHWNKTYFWGYLTLVFWRGLCILKGCCALRSSFFFARAYLWVKCMEKIMQIEWHADSSKCFIIWGQRL